MARRKPYEKIDINVEPFLSIMAIVLKLISLILVAIVMRIAINPKGVRVVAFEQLHSGRGNLENPKAPSYLDCHADEVVIYPGALTVRWEDLQRPGNPVEELLAKVQAKREEEYVVVMVRPGSLRFYRTIRNLISKRPIDVGYDAVDADFKVNWDEAQRALGVVPEGR